MGLEPPWSVRGLSGWIKTHDDQVHTRERRLLGREMIPRLDRLSDPGVHTLDDGPVGHLALADLHVDAVSERTA